jgi:hypothetical protein
VHGRGQRGRGRPDGVFYGKLTPDKVQAIVSKHLKGGEIVTGLCYYDEGKRRYQPYMKDIGFFSEQLRSLFETAAGSTSLHRGLHSKRRLSGAGQSPAGHGP